MKPYGAKASIAAYSIMDDKTPTHAVSDPSAWIIMMDTRYDEIIEIMTQYPTPMTKIGSPGCARIDYQVKVGNNG